MLFHIFYLGVFAYKEAVNAIVLGVLISAVVNAASGHNQHVRPLTNEKVVVDHVLQAAFADYHRNMHAFVLGAGLDVNVDAGAVWLGSNVNVGGGVPPGKAAVGADVVCSLRDGVQVGNLLKDVHLNVVKCHGLNAPFRNFCAASCYVGAAHQLRHDFFLGSLGTDAAIG